MKTGFIGAGNMGGAILKGYLASGANPKDIYVMEADGEKLKNLERELGIIPAYSIESLTAACDRIILGVKPGQFEEVLLQVAGAYKPEKLIITMAAGITISYIEKFLGQEAQIVRIMPNTAAMVGEAMTAICRNKPVKAEAFEGAMQLFSGIGRVEEVPEDLIHCVIGVSGSSPAYTYLYIEALVEAAVKNGMDREKALIFAGQSVLGAAKMVLETGIDPGQLCVNVCSPGGTTIEAVNFLKEQGFKELIEGGFQAAVDKSKKMSK